jgi:hypothetical protein
MADHKKENLEKENLEKEKQMDEVLDSLLANYSSAEPRPGLETRILANLRDAPGREALRGPWNFRWLWAGTAVVAAIVVALVLIGRGGYAPQPPNAVVQARQPVSSQPEIQSVGPETANTIPASHRKKLAPTHHQDVNLALSQRPSVFPTPTPLSEQERLLLSYYSRTPREEMIAQSHPDEPPVVGDQDQTEAIPDLMHIPQKLSNTR